MTPRRRADDVEADVAEVEKFFGTLPKVIRGLRRGRVQNFIIAVSFAVFSLFASHNADVNCAAINANAEGINEAVNTAIASIRMNDTYGPAERRARIASWERVRQQEPACRPLLRLDLP